MPSPAWEDPDDFLQEDDFAFPAVISLQGGATVSLSVIFDEPGMTARAGDFEHDTTGPTATCRADLVAGVKRSDSITITFPTGARTFDVLKTPKPDGTGFAVLDLAPA